MSNESRPVCDGGGLWARAGALVAAGHLHTCALLESGDVRCWGMSDSGQLGLGNTSTIGDDEQPCSVEAVSVGEQARSIAAGSIHNCVLLRSGNIRCWGYGLDGRPGLGNANDIGDDELPTAVDPVSCQ